MAKKNRPPTATAETGAKPVAATDALSVSAVPSAHEYSISNVSLTQGGVPILGSAGHGAPLIVSGIASPPANSATVQVIILYYKDGELVQYATPLPVTFDINTGAWSVQIPVAVLDELAGFDMIIEITANGPDPSLDPGAQRPVHIN